MTHLFNSRRRCVPSLGSQARLGQEHTGDLQKECCTNPVGREPLIAPVPRDTWSYREKQSPSIPPSGRLNSDRHRDRDGAGAALCGEGP